LTWQEHHAQESILNFNPLAEKISKQKINNHSVAYAVCYVISDRERKDLWLQVGSDAQAKVYLNGHEIYKCRWGRGLRGISPLDPVGPIALHKGTNVLVLKVVNGAGQWLGCARFVDQESNPVQGLQVQLTPE
jgi:hypothetical protein